MTAVDHGLQARISANLADHRTAVDELLSGGQTGPIDPIVNGRYRLPNPEGPGHKLYTRATTVAKLLDDTYNLTQWAKRQVALGVARTPSIAAAINADHDDNKHLDRLCEQAITVAGGTEKRDLGTALHRMIERHDRQEHHHDGEWRDHIAAYDRALIAHRLKVRPEWCETVLVNETYGIAGRVDRLLEDPEGRLVVADLKTGGFRSWLAWATQFAIYATATHYWDPVDDCLIPIEPGLIRQDHSLAIHLPAQETPPHCQIHALSVPLGLDAMLMALEVRRLRATDKLPQLQATTYHHPDLLDQLEQSIADTFDPAAQRAALTERISYLRTNHPEALKELQTRWPRGSLTLKQSNDHTQTELDNISKVLDRIEADHGVAF